MKAADFDITVDNRGKMVTKPIPKLSDCRVCHRYKEEAFSL